MKRQNTLNFHQPFTPFSFSDLRFTIQRIHGFLDSAMRIFGEKEEMIHLYSEEHIVNAFKYVVWTFLQEISVKDIE